MITIFTPTYNRKKELYDLYDSLVNQSYKDFEWLVVDDGSNDDTNVEIKKWINEGRININYIYKDNGGKMSAVNMAHKLAKGEIFITVDSDDILVNDILKTVVEDFETIKNDQNIAGIVYQCAYKNTPNKVVAVNLPPNKTVCTYNELHTKYNVRGDKCTAWKTNVLRNYQFPMFEGEKFVPDDYLMNNISRKYKIVIYDKIITNVEYLEGGLTNNYFQLVKKNPNGTALYFKELYDFNNSFYNVYAYILFSIYAKKSFKYIIKNHKAKVKVVLLYLPTLIISKLR